MAKLYFKYGAMNSGKTTSLLQAAHNYEENGMRVVIFKPQKDKKAEDRIQSRLGIERKVDKLVDSEENVFEIVKGIKKESNEEGLDCILVDEAQFLTPDQVDQCMQVTIKLGIPVLCYGLRTDFLNNGFPGSNRLLQIAQDIEELKTMCPCGRKATQNVRFDNKTNIMILSGDQVAIDGEGVHYESRCPACYEKEKGRSLVLTKKKRNKR